MQERMIIAGYGGQGVMLLGKLLAQAAMEAGRKVTYLPAYGTEVRGGTANCHVVFSDSDIYSPVVERPTTLVVMNQASYDRFSPQLARGGSLFINSSLVDSRAGRGQAYYIPATATAAELGAVQVANTVILGALNKVKRLFPRKLILKLLKQTLESKQELLELNRRALKRGEELSS